MFQPDRNPRLRDTVFMSGWLFADLLLALAVLFLAANTIGVKIPLPPPPKLIVTPTRLAPTSPNCAGGISQPRCVVVLTETSDSLGIVNWTARSDISRGIVFTPSRGTLSPGKSVKLQISRLPCENNSITFAGSNKVIPVSILWQCTPPQERLNFNYQPITITNVDYQGLLSNSSQAINTFKHSVEGQSVLKGRSVGLAIVSDGAQTINDVPEALQIAGKVIAILQSLVNDRYYSFQRASYYPPLHALQQPFSTVEIDVYLFIH